VASGGTGAVREEPWLTSLGVSDVAIGVCLRRRVRLGGHYPSERREGWMDVDVDEVILVFFAHV
jgi:hypothetical protein